MGVLDYTTVQVNESVKHDVLQLGAGGYSSSTTVAVDADTWTDVPASFTIPYVSGFSYVSGSTIQFTDDEETAFLFGGNCSLLSGVANKLIEVGLEVNGTYVTGSTSGQRKFSTTTDAGAMAYSMPLTLSENDTIGLVIKADSAMTITINTWQSWAVRF